MNEYERHQELQRVYHELCRTDISDEYRLQLTELHRDLIADLPRDDWTEHEMCCAEDRPKGSKMKKSEAELDAMHRAMFPEQYATDKRDLSDEENLARIDAMYSVECAQTEDGGRSPALLTMEERAIAADRFRRKEGEQWRRRREAADRELEEAPRRKLQQLSQDIDLQRQRLERFAERDRILREMTADEYRQLERSDAFDSMTALDEALGLPALPPDDEQVLDEMYAQLMGGSTAREDGRVDMTEQSADHNRLDLDERIVGAPLRP